MGGTFGFTAASMMELWKKYAGTEVGYAGMGGSARQTNSLIDKASQIGCLQAEAVYDAVRGQGKFEGKKLDARILVVGTNYGRLMIARKEAGINSIKDLAGKRGMFYTAANDLYHKTTGILCNKYGIDFNLEDPTKSTGLTVQTWIGSKDAKEAYMAGQTDAWVFPVGRGLSGHYMELWNAIPSNFVSLSLEDVEVLTDTVPFVLPFALMPGTYPGQTKPARFWSTTFMIGALPEVPDDMAYEMVKALWEHQPEFNEYYLDNQDWALDRAVRADLVENIGLPLHAGVVAYIKDRGLWTDELEAVQKKNLDVIGATK